MERLLEFLLTQGIMLVALFYGVTFLVALVQQNRAEVVLAEAEVPKAIATAFRGQKLGLLDYYELKNLVADTKMRDSIADVGENNETPVPM